MSGRQIQLQEQEELRIQQQVQEGLLSQQQDEDGDKAEELHDALIDMEIADSPAKDHVRDKRQARGQGHEVEHSNIKEPSEVCSVMYVRVCYFCFED